jgi:hypothetical protein
VTQAVVVLLCKHETEFKPQFHKKVGGVGYLQMGGGKGRSRLVKRAGLYLLAVMRMGTQSS